MYLKNQQEQSIKIAVKERKTNDQFIRNNELLALLLLKINQCKKQGQAYPKIVRADDEMQIKFEG